MSSTFDGLYIARSGVRASRMNLNISGQNISNADTDGYTRQRVDQSSIPPSEYGDFWAPTGAECGSGVSADGTSQLRDEFLDGEFRMLNANSGDSSTGVNALYDMEDIFTTTTTASSSSKSSVIDVLSDEYSKLVSQMENLTSGRSGASESAIRDEMKLLASKLNTCAKALNTNRSEQTTDLTKYGTDQVNGLLKNIAALNGRIHDAEVSNQPALELKDQRNLMLDKLSKYVSVQVIKTPVDVGAGRTVDDVSVCLADTNGNTLKDADGKPLYTLVDGKSFAKFSVTADKKNEDGTDSTKSYDITHVRLSGLSTDGGKTFGTDSGMKNSDIKSGTFSGYLKLLNESGEYDTAAGKSTTTARGIGFYSQMLDGLAQNLAKMLNTLNSTNSDAAANPNNPLLEGYDAAGAETADASKITAENIHISSAWKDGYLTLTKDPSNPSDKTSGAFSNIQTMLDQMNNSITELKTGTGVSVFSGKFPDALANVSASLAREANSLQTTDNTNSYLLGNVSDSRQSISSVSLDDEAVSIVQFSQSLNASSRFMTAVDECLQTIINNMGIAGRG